MEQQRYMVLEFTTILTFIFIVLKLMGFIDWSWFWVVSPTLIYTLVQMVGFVVLLLYFCILWFITLIDIYIFKFRRGIK